MFIAYQDLLKFNVIHTNFPYEVLTYTVTADVIAKIKHCFSDVLSDDLNPTPMKTPTPMVISLQENTKPKFWLQDEFHNNMRNQQKPPFSISSKKAF